MKQLFWVLCLMLLWMPTQAQITFLTGNEIPKSKIELEDEWYLLTPGAIINNNQQCVVSLELDEFANASLQGGNWQIDVPVDIYLWSRTGIPLPTQNRVLSLSWNNGELAVDKSLIVIPDVYKVRVEVQNLLPADIGLLTDEISLQVEFRKQIDYNMSAMAIPDFRLVGDEIEFYWPFVAGAERYELEWVFVEHETTFKPFVSSMFSRATRVVTNEEFYRISNVFYKGDIYFRVRVLTNSFGSSNQTNFYSAWSPVNLSRHKINIAGDFENDKTWTYNATYSSKGVHAEDIVYLDATGRSRQTIAKNQQDQVTTIAEELYDYNGVSSISTTPSIQPGMSLGYVESFLQNELGTIYDKSNYTLDSKLEAPDKLAEGISGNNYFSANNPFIGDGFSDYLPKANGYGFTTTTFDNQGRIMKQSGVGEALRMGGGHETEMTYGSVSQTEIDRLFGNEVGIATHYSQLIITDPNGVNKVQYFDLAGRMIAEGIVGDAPTTLQPITTENYGVETTITDDLSVSHNVKNEEERRTYLNYDLPVKKNGIHKFKVAITETEYQNNCGSSDCVYDFVFRITDKLGEPVAFDVIDVNSNATSYPIKYVETLNAASFNNGSFTLDIEADLTIGQVKIWKELRINEAALEANLAAFEQSLRTPNPSCDWVTPLSTLENDYTNDIYANVDDYVCNACYTACQDFAVSYLWTEDQTGSPYTNLDDYNLILTSDINKSFYNIVGSSLPAPETLDAYKEGSYQTDYETIYKACKIKVCDEKNIAPPEIVKDCSVKKKVFLNDLSPGGQYFDNRDATNLTEANQSGQGKLEEAEDPNAHLWLQQTFGYSFYSSGLGYNWMIKDPVSGNNIRLVDYMFNSNLAVNWETFRKEAKKFWNPDWALDLLDQHPEICELNWCEHLDNLEGFASEVKVMSYLEAKSELGIDFSTSNESDFDQNSLLLKDKISMLPASMFTLTGTWQGNFLNYYLEATTNGVPTEVLNYPDENCDFANAPGGICPPQTIMEMAKSFYEKEQGVAYSSSGNSVEDQLKIDERVWNYYRNIYLTLRSSFISHAHNEYYYNNGCDKSDFTFVAETDPNYYTEGEPFTYEGATGNQFKVNFPFFDFSELLPNLNGGNPVSSFHGLLLNDKLQGDVGNLKCGDMDVDIYSGTIYVSSNVDINIGTGNPQPHSMWLEYNQSEALCGTLANSCQIVETVRHYGPPSTIQNAREYIEFVNSSIPWIHMEETSVDANYINVDSYGRVYPYQRVFVEVTVNWDLVTLPLGSFSGINFVVDVDYGQGGLREQFKLKERIRRPVIGESCDGLPSENCFCEKLADLRTEYDQYLVDYAGNLNDPIFAENEISITAGFAGFAVNELGKHYGHKVDGLNGWFFTDANEYHPYDKITGQEFTEWENGCAADEASNTNYNKIRHPEKIIESPTTPGLPVFASAIYPNAFSKSVPVELTCYNPEDECLRDALKQAKEKAKEEFENSVTAAVDKYKKEYLYTCLNKVNEKVEVEHDVKEYMYTLYYYDVAGNLRATVYPEGVRILNAGQIQMVQDHRGEPVEFSSELGTYGPGPWEPSVVGDPARFISMYTIGTGSIGFSTDQQYAGAIRHLSGLTPGNYYTIELDLVASAGSPGSCLAVYDGNGTVLTNPWASGTGTHQVTFQATTATGYIHICNGGLTGTVYNYQISRFVVTTGGSITPPIYLEDMHVRAQTVFYDYNTLGNVYRTESRDAGISNLIYDEYGRQVLSQNAKQANPTTGNKRFNYVTYDHLGRTKESGEISHAQADLASIELIAANENTPGDYNSWLGGGDKRETSVSFYQSLPSAVLVQQRMQYGVENSKYGTQRNLLTAVAYYEEGTDNTPQHLYDNAVSYYYDHQDRLTTYVTHHPKEGSALWALKTTNYYFDGFTGLNERIEYQPGKQDQFTTYFEYEKNMRLARTYTSDNGGIVKELEQKNLYYLHGGLRRIEVGEHQIQGMDFATTLQGWTKGVNSNTLSPYTDMGRDGISHDFGVINHSPTALANKSFARDVASYSIQYFDGDYQASNNLNNGGNSFEAQGKHGDILSVQNDYFNGMIGASVSTIRNAGPNGNLQPLPQYSVYQHDVAYRFKELQNFISSSILADNRWDNGRMRTGVGHSETSVKLESEHYVAVDYDMNGNIKEMYRNGGDGAPIDDMTYVYSSATHNGIAGLDGNQLRNVTTTPGSHDADIGYGDASFYQYDEIGQLVFESPSLTTYHWNANHKIKAITHLQNQPGDDLEFLYDPMGMRIGKIVKPRPGTGPNQDQAPFFVSDESTWDITYYALDPSGNVMATYREERDAAGDPVQTILQDHTIGFESRIGLKESGQIMDINWNAPDQYENEVGRRLYEFKNWLGNVTTVFTDLKLFRQEEQTQSISTSFEGGDAALFSSWNPYVTPGMLESGQGVGGSTAVSLDASRPWGPLLRMRVAAGDEVNDVSIQASVQQQTMGVDGGNLKRCLVDQNGQLLFLDAAGNVAEWVGQDADGSITGYQALGFPTDLTVPSLLFREDGVGSGNFVPVDWDQDEVFVVVFPWMPVGNNPTYFDDLTFEVVNKSGGYYEPVIEQAMDYFPFGMPMPGRQFTSPTGTYRYGFQGQERDDEVKGEGIRWNYTYRMHDAALGRFFAVDPLGPQFPYNSPYAFSENSTIAFIELEGLEKFYAASGEHLGSVGEDNSVYSIEFQEGESVESWQQIIEDAGGNCAEISTQDAWSALFERAINLDISHKDFKFIAAKINAEGRQGGFELEEDLWLAHTFNNNKKKYRPNSSLRYTAQRISSSNETNLSDSNTGQHNSARRGLISVLRGDADPTGGATFWDGTDFLAWGLNSPNGTPHNKFEEYQIIQISSTIYDTYLNANLDYYTNNQARYSGKFYPIPELVFTDQNNWLEWPFDNHRAIFLYHPGYVNNGIKLRAVGTRGHTIFWETLTGY